ncbi:RidA family protein [Micrococcus porci]|uniref:RidA family protein n=1 Tax=Micrococcus TaxID=1269 RepID=UPI001CC96261|nr:MULTISPECIES: RidA family protein [Micrococcus]MCG7422803.1 RidA family protein [Micrococcus sp. ACRRV]UBH25524.1 RidA family protein [Micrococcus porci]
MAGQNAWGGGPAAERLAALGIERPAVAAPVGSYVPAVRDGDLVLTSGQLPFVAGALPRTGKVGAEVTLEQAQELARTAAVNAVAAVHELVGDLEAVVQVVKVVGFVASAPDFTAQPAVVNGASDVLAEIFGEAGRHARSAVGVAVLPLDSPVEVEITVRVR